MSAVQGSRDSRERAALERLIDRLSGQFPGVPAQRLRELAHREYATFEGSRIRDFVLIFVERAVRAEVAPRTALSTAS